MNINYSKIGKRIADSRKELGITQSQLAEMVGLSKNHISNIETGGSYSLDAFLSICDALKITPDYILFGTIRKEALNNVTDVLKLCNDWELSLLQDFAETLIKNRQS